MANTMATVSALPEMGVKQRLQDPYKMCRLCFQSPGIHDVSVAPFYLQAIKQLYNIVVSSDSFNALLFCCSCIFCDWTNQNVVHLFVYFLLWRMTKLDSTSGQIHKIGMQKMYWVHSRIFQPSRIGESWTTCLYKAYRNDRTGMLLFCNLCI